MNSTEFQTILLSIIKTYIIFDNNKSVKYFKKKITSNIKSKWHMDKYHYI